MNALDALYALPPLAAAAGWLTLRRRALDRWLPGYLASFRSRGIPDTSAPVHLLLCVADHYEPRLGGAKDHVAWQRVARWTGQYPRLFSEFRDSDGRPPRHTFFYPVEDYQSDLIDALTPLCRAGFGEVEVHLHHDRDTAANLRDTLLAARDLLSDRHGQLARDRRSGQVRYGFIHGNWALANSCPGGRWCGVDGELGVLQETGCYADFTLPSAPSRAQTRTVNRIYYADCGSRRRRPHDRGHSVGPGAPPHDSLMLVQGPLLLNWTRRKWGVLPRVENGCLQGNQPPSLERMRLWLGARVQVAARPDWFFVKLHTHGASEVNMPVLLGEPMIQFHRDLARLAAENPDFRYHYVTAREMYNLIRAAADGWQGGIAEARDYELVWNGGRSSQHGPAQTTGTAPHNAIPVPSMP